MQPEFTPGPWFVADSALDSSPGDDGPRWDVHVPHGATVAYVRKHHDARLTAAAPDGYALAEDAADFLLATFGQVSDESNREGWSNDDAFELYTKLTRFMARARGETEATDAA